MKNRISLRLRRYLTAQDFRDQLKQLKAFRGAYHGNDLLDWFESTGLVRPIIRLAWPEPVARRWWREGHDWAGEMREPLEPDGDRFDAAEALHHALSRVGIRGSYADTVHPLDDPAPEWAEFLQADDQQVFVPRGDRRFSIGNARVRCASTAVMSAIIIRLGRCSPPPSWVTWASLCAST